MKRMRYDFNHPPRQAPDVDLYDIIIHGMPSMRPGDVVLVEDDDLTHTTPIPMKVRALTVVAEPVPINALTSEQHTEYVGVKKRREAQYEEWKEQHGKD